ncbi:MAG: hypothetical protein ABIJ30_01875 [bacterium]
MSGISPISGAGGGAYNAYFYPGFMPRVNIPNKAGTIDPFIPINPIKPVSVLPENNKVVNSWAIDSFKSIFNFFSKTDSMDKNEVSEIQTQCSVCRNREYTCSNGETSDGKQTVIPGHESAERIRQHEAEHLRIARMNAEAQGKMVVAQQINTTKEKCSECGETYVSKGEAITETVRMITTQHRTYNPSRNYPEGPELRLEGIGRFFDGYG